MPNQSLLYTGRVLACSQLPAMMHIARELCGGQICLTPDAATFAAPRGRRAGWRSTTRSTTTGSAEDRRKLLAFARDLLNSDYAGHRLTFQLFAQSPPFAHLAAVYRNFDFAGPARRWCRRRRALRARAPAAGRGGHERRSDEPPAHPSLQHARHLSRAAARQRPLPGRGRGQHGLSCAARSARISRPRSRSASATPRRRPSRRWPTSRCCSARPARGSRTSASSSSTSPTPATASRCTGWSGAGCGRLPGVHRPGRRGARRAPSGWSRSTSPPSSPAEAA